MRDATCPTRDLVCVLRPAQLELEEVRLQLQEWNDSLQQQMRALRAAGRGDEATALTEALSEAAVDPNASWGVIKVPHLPIALHRGWLPAPDPERIIPA